MTEPDEAAFTESLKRSVARNGESVTLEDVFISLTGRALRE